MRKFALAILAASLLSAPAVAADLPMRAPAPVPYVAPIFTWTGFYIGGNVGGTWFERRWHDSLFGFDFGHTSDGKFIGGGQVGYNWQFNTFVVGVEADIDGIANNNNGNRSLFVPGVGTLAVSTSGGGNWVATVAARLGFAVNNWLIYGKIGGGWVDGSGDLRFVNTAAGTAFAVNGGGTRGGVLGGAGVEYAFTPNWTVKAEYNYLSLDNNRSFIVPVGAPFLVGDTFAQRNRNLQMVKIGVNYLFK